MILYTAGTCLQAQLTSAFCAAADVLALRPARSASNVTPKQQRHTHNTRLTPEKPQHGGARPGAGRPKKENRDPTTPPALSLGPKVLMEEAKTREEYCQQQEQLTNSKGRSWSYHECTLILTW
ncbi:MAG TPA: hypothetical protein VGN34_22935 [Ktedonobacteraceae bacterium]